jgi:hypothetical protein
LQPRSGGAVAQQAVLARGGLGRDRHHVQLLLQPGAGGLEISEAQPVGQAEVVVPMG